MYVKNETGTDRKKIRQQEKTNPRGERTLCHPPEKNAFHTNKTQDISCPRFSGTKLFFISFL